MKIYFLSASPCALTLNGVFFGVTDRFERSAEISLSDGVYAQFSPQGALPVGFFLTEQILSHPPEGVEVYLLKDGAALYVYDFPPTDLILRPVAQLREGDTLATVYRQGKLQLSIDSPKGFFNAYLPPAFDECTLSMHRDFLFLYGDETLGVYNRECRCLLLERATNYRIEEELLYATLPLSDSRGRIAECSWRLDEEECSLQSCLLKQSVHEGVPADLLAYAFFESVLLKADVLPFLSEALQPDAENIVAFLGEFTAVTLTDEPTTCGLVRKKGERLFSLDYFSVKIQEDKIIDVFG